MTYLDQLSPDSTDRKKKEKGSPLEKKFKSLFSTVKSTIQTAERLELTLDRTQAQTQLLEDVDPERKSSLVAKMQEMTQRHASIKERLVEDLELLDRLQADEAFTNYNSPVIEARIKKIAKELELLQKQWLLRSVSKEIRGKNTREATSKETALYLSFKKPIRAFTELFTGSPFEQEAIAINKQLTEIKDRSEMIQLVLSAERIAQKSREYFKKPAKRKEIDAAISQLAHVLNLSNDLQASRIESYNQENHVTPFKSIEWYTDNPKELQQDLDHILKDYAYQLPSEENEAKDKENERALLEMKKLGQRFEKAVTPEQKKAIYDELFERIHTYTTPEESEYVHEDELAHFSADKVDEYIAIPNLFVRETEDQLHAINIELSSSGIVPEELYDAHDKIVEEALKVGKDEFSENESHAQIKKVDELIYEYALDAALLQIEDEDNDYSFEDYANHTIALILQSTLDIKDTSILKPDHLSLVKEIQTLSSTCSAKEEPEERKACLKATLDKAQELHLLLRDLPPKESLAYWLHEKLGAEPSKENPPQIDLYLTDPNELKEILDKITDWMVEAHGFEGQRELISQYYEIPLDNFNKLLTTGRIAKKIGATTVYEDVPEESREKSLSRMIRAINKGILRFVKTEKIARRSPRGEETFTDTITYPDLGEFDEETGLYNGKIGAGTTVNENAFDVFPKKDPLEVISALDFSKTGPELTSIHNLVNQSWNLKSKLVEKRLMDQVPEYATIDERNELQSKISRWRDYAQTRLDRTLSRPTDADEILLVLNDEIRKIEREFEQLDKKKLIQKWNNLLTTSLENFSNIKIVNLTEEDQAEFEQKKAAIIERAKEYIEEAATSVRIEKDLDSIQRIDTSITAKLRTLPSALINSMQNILSARLSKEAEKEQQTTTEPPSPVEPEPPVLSTNELIENAIADSDALLKKRVKEAYPEKKSFTEEQLKELENLFHSYVKIKLYLLKSSDTIDNGNYSFDDWKKAVETIFVDIETLLSKGGPPVNSEANVPVLPSQVESLIDQAKVSASLANNNTKKPLASNKNTTNTEAPKPTNAAETNADTPQESIEEQIQSIKETLSTAPNLPPRLKQALKRRALDLDSEESKKLYFNTALEAFNASTGIEIEAIPSLKSVPLPALQMWTGLKELSALTGIDLATHTYEKPVTAPRMSRLQRKELNERKAKFENAWQQISDLILNSGTSEQSFMLSDTDAFIEQNIATFGTWDSNVIQSMLKDIAHSLYNIEKGSTISEQQIDAKPAEFDLFRKIAESLDASSTNVIDYF